jgi:uncharacterized protein involved in exopolysaccharide biosynthesis
MPQLPELQEDEIDPRDYIKVISKRKKVILAVFFVAVITTTVVSFLMPKIYRANVTLMITPSRLRDVLSPTQVILGAERKNIGEYLFQEPAISLSTHNLLLKSGIVLERLINKLDLNDKSGKKLAPEDLSNRLEIKETKETNILQLQVNDDNPKMAKEIANAWAREYIEYNQELILGGVKGTGEFITDQFEIAKQTLTKTEEEVRDFKDKYKIDLMRAELNIKKSNLNDYKKEILGLEIALKTKEDSLKELKKQIEKQEKFIIVSKAVTDDALWQREGKNIADLGRKKLRSEQVNLIYQSLETRIVNTEIDINTLKPRAEYLKKSIELTENEIKDLEESVNQKEFELTQLIRQVEIYKRTYDNLSTKIEDVRIAKSAQLGEVKIISPASEPKYPIGPKKRQNVAIAGFVGLMLGIFIAFFQEFWQRGISVEKKRI